MLGNTGVEGPWAMVSPEEQAASVHDLGLSMNAGRTQAGGRGEAVGISQRLGNPMAVLVSSPAVGLRCSPCFVLTLLGLRRLWEQDAGLRGSSRKPKALPPPWQAGQGSCASPRGPEARQPGSCPRRISSALPEGSAWCPAFLWAPDQVPPQTPLLSSEGSERLGSCYRTHPTDRKGWATVTVPWKF